MGTPIGTLMGTPIGTLMRTPIGTPIGTANGCVHKIINSSRQIVINK